MKLTAGITLLPILHGRVPFAGHVRSLCNRQRFDLIALDLPPQFGEELTAAVDNLPFLSAVVAQGTSEPAFFIPADPCDAMIEGIRQARQNHGACQFIGYPLLAPLPPLAPMPDEYAIGRIGFEAYAALCLQALGNPAEGSEDDLAGQYIAWRLHQLRLEHEDILALVHLRHFSRVVYHFTQEKTHNLRFAPPPTWQVATRVINPDHLYFALGELPFVTGKYEKERYDPLASPADSVEIIKDLFRETRDNFYDRREDAIDLSPVRIQAALSFLRNLTVTDGRFLPTLFDIVTAARGVGGNSYAVRILKNARYYPYLPYESETAMMAVGIDTIRLPGAEGPLKAVNLLRDTQMYWRKLTIKPDPSQLKKTEYRYRWNPFGMCSHLPEDRRIESFNAYVRAKTLRTVCEDFTKTEKFATSIKDGIDIRETLRNWYTGNIYIKEIPPSRGNVDTVVIIFDEDHDERYPQCATWYAEHPDESTLTFYATDPFADLIGPGIARSRYGGLSLLFPPRPIPSAFELTEKLGLKKLSHRLLYGALLFSQEKVVACIAPRKPGIAVREMARKFKKHLVWIPLSQFSSETLRRLQRFHVLNGKSVRSWASRFIGD